jgi:hypothetical protein
MLYKYEGSSLGCTHAYTQPREILAIASFWPNSETLATHIVRAHPGVAFHLCMCGLRGDTAAVAATLISYDNRGGYCRDDHKEDTIVNNYFLYTDARLS